MVVDGLLGSPLAAKTPPPWRLWVHYRGFVVLALLLVGKPVSAGVSVHVAAHIGQVAGTANCALAPALRNKWLAVGR
ncbi:MAG: hypothetical protein R2851_24920 [Caldilineaceae bacterium]